MPLSPGALLENDRKVLLVGLCPVTSPAPQSPQRPACELYINYFVQPALSLLCDLFIQLFDGPLVIPCSGLLCKNRGGWMFLGLFSSHIYMFLLDINLRVEILDPKPHSYF